MSAPFVRAHTGEASQHTPRCTLSPYLTLGNNHFLLARRQIDSWEICTRTGEGHAIPKRGCAPRHEKNSSLLFAWLTRPAPVAHECIPSVSHPGLRAVIGTALLLLCTVTHSVYTIPEAVHRNVFDPRLRRYPMSAKFKHQSHSPPR